MSRYRDRAALVAAAIRLLRRQEQARVDFIASLEAAEAESERDGWRSLDEVMAETDAIIAGRAQCRPIFLVLAKAVVPDRLNQLWVADLTYVAIPGGFVYLAAILDAWSPKVVGYAISRSIDSASP